MSAGVISRVSGVPEDLYLLLLSFREREYFDAAVVYKEALNAAFLRQLADFMNGLVGILGVISKMEFVMPVAVNFFVGSWNSIRP